MDSNGNSYITGVTTSFDMPIQNGFQTVCMTCDIGNFDAFVASLNSTGSSLRYSTHLGGSQQEDAQGIALDTAGSIWISGGTISADFPTTPNGLQPADPSAGAVADGFFTGIETTAVGEASRLYSSYFGGSGGDASDFVSGLLLTHRATWSSQVIGVPCRFQRGGSGLIRLQTAPGTPLLPN